MDKDNPDPHQPGLSLLAAPPRPPPLRALQRAPPLAGLLCTVRMFKKWISVAEESVDL